MYKKEGVRPFFGANSYIIPKIKGAHMDSFIFSAEREGFEPPEPLSSTVFKTAAIDHSAISPKIGCKGTTFF